MASVRKETELTVRTDNVPGAEGRVLSTVSGWNVQVRALCSYAEGEKLMVLLVADDPKRARQALGCAGYECKANPVIVVAMENRLGAVARLGARLNTAGVEILYSYASYMDDADIVAVFKTHDDLRALTTLQSSLQTAEWDDVQSAVA